MKFVFSRIRLVVVLVCLSIGLTACSAQKASDFINPFVDSSKPELGDRDTSALLDTGVGKASEDARHALEVIGSYRRTQTPQPGYPVLQPAEVRLMWVPDHLNKHGDLIPAHYYYLKVLEDRWAVQDAFDLERQLNKSTPGSGPGSATPWIYKQ